MRSIYNMFLIGVAFMLSSCIDENFEQGPAKEGKEIKFGLASPKTRTIYDDDNTSQINWVSGDGITIYCNEAESTKKANYNVTPASESHKGSITAAGDAYLSWGGDSETHNFFAVYPNDVSIEDGIAAFPINRNQKATVTTTDGTENDVVAVPDMTNAYMVAKKSTAPTDDPVILAFEPIMTTLQVVITAADVNMNETGSARVTGISFASAMTTTSSASRDVFYYDINDGVITANGAETSGTASIVTEQTFVNIVDTDGNVSYVDLAAGHTLTITAFLPPVSKEAAAMMKRQLKVRVHATGNAELVASLKTNDESSDSWTTQLTPGAKRRVILPALPKSTSLGNNWITPLDDNIYVSQMSIPGAHDAATGEEMATIVGDIFASTQEQPLQSQWDLGVRVFDLRPAIYTKSFIQGEDDDELWLYHGMTRVDLSWTNAINTIKANLTDNPGEFAIIIFRHEDESTVGKDNDSDRFNTFMTSFVETNKDWIVDWKPDLTIGECRGKIILISRFSGSWSYGCFTGWSHDATGATTTLRNADGLKSATMYVQDYYNPSSHDTKWTSIKTYLDISETFHTDANKVNHWMINHASGYVGTSSSTTYRENAAAQNPKLISYITSDSWEGSTGIVLFDYAGASLSNGFLTGNIEVDGDIALQTIIDNNYKYRMKRKGE